jgi:Histidine kinase-, DNA gyrase B-, and HSP90-like ATPase
MSYPDDPNAIDASPTKQFFIYMLTVDIELVDAILDLADNCFDGARRLRGDSGYDGLTIRVDVSKDHFKIADNCGGIPIEVARDYAFRFGRDPNAPPTPHSMGRFGVGMKRALLKMGKKFEIESKTTVSQFSVEIDVERWEHDPEWEFHFKKREENIEIGPELIGTIITVTALYPEIAEKFALDNFETKLRMELESAHQEVMQKGLAFTLNGIPLNFRPSVLLQSDDLGPAFKEMELPGRNGTPVNVKLYAGLGQSAPREAGWYVFCNGRMILEASQDEVTGWGEGGGKEIPKFHNQFARFRGFAFFDSDDPSSLPWNTTKTGLNEDSPGYQAVRLEMIAMMRPVFNFLNKLDKEKEEEEEDVEAKQLEKMVKAAKPAKLTEIQKREVFQAPERKTVPARPQVRVQKIQYSKPAGEVEEVKRKLRVTSFKEVGERTFEYFYENECEE